MTPFRQYGRALLLGKRLVGAMRLIKPHARRLGWQVRFVREPDSSATSYDVYGLQWVVDHRVGVAEQRDRKYRRRGGALHPVRAGSRDGVKLRAGDAFGAAP
jgi:hypothetical protein